MATRKNPAPEKLPETQFDKATAAEEKRDFGILSEQPKVKVRLALIPGDKQNLPLEVFLNGVPYFIPRGVSVEVPEDIADILTHAGAV